MLLLLPCKIALCQDIKSFELTNKLSILNNWVFRIPCYHRECCKFSKNYVSRSKLTTGNQDHFDIDKTPAGVLCRELYKFSKSEAMYRLIICKPTER